MAIKKLAKNIIFLALLCTKLTYGVSGFNEPRHLPMIPTWINRWWSSLNLPAARTQDPELTATLDAIRHQRAVQDQFGPLLAEVLPQIEPALQRGESSLVRTIAERFFVREISLEQLNQDLPISPYTIHLKVSSKYHTDITAYHLHLIGKKFPNIKELDVSRTGLTDQKLIVLVLQPYASRLTQLNVSNNQLRLANKQIVNYRGAFPNLVSLDISNNPIADRGLRVIAQQPFAENLTYLNISLTRITLDARKLTISYTITTTEIKAIIDSFKTLKQLKISHNRIGDAGFELLAQARFAAELSSLDVSNTQLTTTGIEKSMHAFSGLTSLDVSANAIGDRGLEVIANQPFAPDLTLYLGSADVTPEEISKNKHKFKRILIKFENKTR